ncbi:unnamed protein product [Didymodactylos carnosus]|uniref:Transmembrane protein n=1 Tax=Didymodactylos carnosus TaxID=1234261 RepID=A0A813YXT5_9BILA|nr:unnamed protein product [Didymodactylos carnosus]CAF3675588.1 unnamed protein product [Didymodactylos carnosus]
MFYKTPFPSLFSYLLLMIGSAIFTMATVYSMHKMGQSDKWGCKKCLLYGRIVVGCSVAFTCLLGLFTVLLATMLSGKTRKKYFWGHKKNVCATILNGFFLFITFLTTLGWLSITCVTIIPLYALLYNDFIVCRKEAKSTNFLHLLNEISHELHQNDKHKSFTIFDLCTPIFLMISMGANHAHIINDQVRYEVTQNGEDIEETKM